MIRVQQDFRDRVAEIECYLGVLSEIELGNASIVKQNSNEQLLGLQQRDNLLRTCRASAFLLLYNLMESTISNAIESIFDTLSNQEISFDACRMEIRHVVLNNLKQYNAKDILIDINVLATDVISRTFRKEKIFSGNVDARQIKKVANEYGFSPPSADGRDLLTVKASRNDLAHGSKSFSEVGRDYTMSTIIDIKEKVIAYLDSMLTNVADYINNKLYLASKAI